MVGLGLFGVFYRGGGVLGIGFYVWGYCCYLLSDLGGFKRGIVICCKRLKVKDSGGVIKGGCVVFCYGWKV